MSQIVIGKTGGTSNKDADSVLVSMERGWECQGMVVSAPGKMDDSPLGDKVTNQLLRGYGHYISTGEYPNDVSDGVTERYAEIVNGLDFVNLGGRWIDNIAPRVEQAAKLGKDSASFIGEELMSEIYQAAGFTLLSPYLAPSSPSLNIRDVMSTWRSWLYDLKYGYDEHYVMPGNTVKVMDKMMTFSRGGSDVTQSIWCAAAGADMAINYTDNQAYSADPRLIERSRLRTLNHLAYVVMRNLGLNGTGLFHPDAAVPLMIEDIPALVTSTFDVQSPSTLLNNDLERMEPFRGQPQALSMMPEVVTLRIYEPGMASVVGRGADFLTALSGQGIAYIDSLSSDFDSERILLDSSYADRAKAAVAARVESGGAVHLEDERSLITLVGYDLESNHAQLMQRSKEIDGLHGDPEIDGHQMRFYTDSDNAVMESVASDIHGKFIESV